MKSSRNVTFSLPFDLIRRAKIIAAKRDTSLNALVLDALTQVVERADDYREAAECLLIDTQAGLFEMPAKPWNREELYERSSR